MSTSGSSIRRADAGMTYYNTHSVDVILSVPRPPTSGFSATAAQRRRAAQQGL